MLTRLLNSIREGLRGVPPLGSDLSCAPIFIVGCGRSGTTLLRLILNRHPELAIFGESAMFFRDRKYAFLSNPRALERFTKDWSVLFAQHSPYTDLLMSGGLQEKLACSKTYVAATSLVMDLFREAEQKSVWGEKTPAHVTRLRKVFSAYPKARVIHITRDPRAVVSSATIHLGDGRFDAIGVYSTARYWVRCEKEIHRYFSKSPEQIAIIRYEDLIGKTEKTVRDLCDFLRVSYDGDMLNTSTSAERYAPKAAGGGEVMTLHRGLLRDINAEAVDKWRDTLSPDMTRLVEQTAGGWLDRRGYIATSDRAARLAVGLGSIMLFSRWLVLEARRIFYRLAISVFWNFRARASG